jgi:hypothetical protein
MRKRFVRLALIAAVVLVAFLLYKNTEGFGDYVSPISGLTCANAMSNKFSIRAAKNQPRNPNEINYTCVFNKPNPLTNELKTPICSNKYKVGSWIACPNGFVQKINSTTHKCYSCTK